MEEFEEQRFFKSECQSGAGTARYDSASLNSTRLRELGDEAKAEADSELLFSDKKLRSGVKS